MSSAADLCRMGDTESGGSGDEISDSELDKRFGDTLMIEGDLIDAEALSAPATDLYGGSGYGPPVFPAGMDPMVIPDDVLNLDQDTQDRLQALLQAAGITKLAEGKNVFADPGVFRRLTTSVGCALDEAADALGRMKSGSSNPQDTGIPDPSQLLFGPGATGDFSRADLPPLLMNSQNCAVAAAQQQAVAFSGLDPVALAAAVNSTGPPGEWGLAAITTAPSGMGGQNSAPETPVVEEGESLLSLACSAGYYELAQVLLAMRTNVEDRGSKGDCTPLMEAASAGHSDIVKLLIAHNADVNAQSSTGNTPLMYACAGGHEEVVKALLEAEADVEIRNENGHSPGMEAASAGHVNIARLLVENGAAVQSQAVEFKVGLESPLTLACYKGHIEMVRFLLSVGPKADKRQEELHTALMEASMDGHLEVARLLLDFGAPVNLTSESFESPLTLAACGGHLDLVRLLLDRGAQIEDPNDEGYTPLMESAREGHEDVVELLLDRGAEINAQTEETGETALTLAACGGFKEVVELLVDRGADLDLGANTPLMESAQEGHLDTVKYLIQATLAQRLSIDASTATGDTALTYAAENGHTEVCAALLDSGAKIDHESEGGRTALMKSTKCGNYQTTQFLLSRGADINKTTLANDHCPLSLACANGHYDVTELLLLNGADPNHKLKDSSTCIIEAAKGGHTTVVQLLLDWPGIQLPVFSAAPPTLQQLAVSAAQPPTVAPPAQRVQNSDNTTQLQKDAKTKSAEMMMSYLQQQHTATETRPTDETKTDSAAEPPEPSAFNLTVDPGFLSSLQQNTGLGVLANQGSGTTPAFPPLPGLNITIPEQREWLLLQAQRALLKQAGDKLAPAELNQLNEILKAQFRQMFPVTGPTTTAPVPQPPPAPLTTTTAPVQQPGKRKVPGAPPPQQANKTNLEGAVKEMKHLQLQDGKLAMLQKGMREAYLEGMQAREEFEKMKKQATELAQQKQQGTERGTQTTLTLQQNIQAASSVESVAKQEDQANLVFPLTSSSGGSAAASFNFQLPPPPPPTAKTTSAGATEPIYATPTTNHQPQVPVGKTNASTQASLPSQGHTQSHSETAAGTKTAQKTGAGVDLNTQTESNHDTALTLACAGGHEELVLLLLQRGADLEHRDKKGFTPLILAATAGHAGVVELLLSHGASIEAQSERTKDTALSLACSGGRKEVVDILLKRSANKEHRNVSDYTPLSLAASGGYVEIIQLLLNYGAEINSRTGSKLGISPLMLAAMNGHAQAVKLLLERGSDINAQIETNRNTALTLACFQGRHEVVKLLLDYRANVEHRAKTGLTPLMEAASGGYVEVGRVLLHYGADPNAAPVPSSRDTALTIAADKGHHKFVDLLLHHGAAVDARNKKGCTSLWLACHGGHLEAVQTLVKHGGDVDANDNRKVTPLMAAFRRGNMKVVKWLVRHVNQFPSDQECARFITTITDKDLLVKCRQCMDVIVAAKDRQAAEANKAAATLLLQLEEEEKLAETRRQAKQRQKEKKKAKRQAKKAAQKPTEEDVPEDAERKERESDEDSGKSKSASPPYSAPAPKAVPEEFTEEDEEEEEAEEVSQEDKKESEEERQPSPDLIEKGKRTPPGNRKGDWNEERDERVPAMPESAAEDRKEVSGMMERRTAYGTRGHLGPERRQRGFRRGGGARGNLTVGHGLGEKRVSPVPPRKGPGRGDEGWMEQEWSRAERRRGPGKVQPIQQRKTEWTNSRNHGNQLIIQEDPSPQNGDWREATKKKPNRLVVSSQAIARVIGRGGQNINAIREATGAHIEVEKQQPRREQQDRHITIRGSTEASRQAWLMINGLIQDPELPVADIIKKIRAKDKNAMQQYAAGQPQPPPGTTQHSQQPSGTTVKQTVPSSAGQKRNFPEVSVWVPSTGARQKYPNSGSGKHPSNPVTAVHTTSNVHKHHAAAPLTTAAPVSVAEPTIVARKVDSASTEYSPFATPNYNVWHKRAEQMQMQGQGNTAKRMDFASVAASGIKSVAQSQPCSFPLTAASGAQTYTNAPSNQVQGQTVATSQPLHRSPAPSVTQSQSSGTSGDAPEKAPGYRRGGGAVTPIGAGSSASSTTGGGHQASTEDTPPSAASLSPPLANSLGTEISFFQDQIRPLVSGTKSAFSSPAGAQQGGNDGLSGVEMEPRNLSRFGLTEDHFSPISLPPVQLDRPASATPILGTRIDDASQFSVLSSRSHAPQSSVTPPIMRYVNNSQTGEMEGRRDVEQERNPSPVPTGMRPLSAAEVGVLKMPIPPVSATWRGPTGGVDWSTAGRDIGVGVVSTGNNSISNLGSLSANLAKLQMDSGTNQSMGISELIGGGKSNDWMNSSSSIFGNPAQGMMQQGRPITAAPQSRFGFANQPRNQVGAGGDLGMAGMFPPVSAMQTQANQMGGQGWAGNGLPAPSHMMAPFPSGQENYDELFKHLAGNILNMYRNQQTPPQHQLEQGLGGFPPGNHQFGGQQEAYHNHQQHMYNPNMHPGYHHQQPPIQDYGTQMEQRFLPQQPSGPPFGGWGDNGPSQAPMLHGPMQWQTGVGQPKVVMNGGIPGAGPPTSSTSGLDWGAGWGM